MALLVPFLTHGKTQEIVPQALVTFCKPVLFTKAREKKFIFLAAAQLRGLRSYLSAKTLDFDGLNVLFQGPPNYYITATEPTSASSHS